MICQTCFRPVPDMMVTCPACVQERSKAAMRAFQYRPLRMVGQGKASFTTRAISGIRHVQMFGAELTFCGEVLQSGNRRAWINLNDYDERAESICPKCRAEVGALMMEALKCSA
jgi:hypothetical protein